MRNGKGFDLNSSSLVGGGTNPSQTAPEAVLHKANSLPPSKFSPAWRRGGCGPPGAWAAPTGWPVGPEALSVPLLTSAPPCCLCPGSSSAATSHWWGQRGVSAGRQLPAQPGSRTPAWPGPPQPGQSPRSSALHRHRHGERLRGAQGTGGGVTVFPLKDAQREAHPP